MTIPRTVLVGLLLAAGLLGALVLLLGHDEAASRVDVAHACPDRMPEAGFTDVSGTHERTIDCAAWYGFARGKDADHYEPAADVTRGQMASFVVRLLDYVAEQSSAHARPAADDDRRFRDIAGHTHEDAIRRLAGVGIVRGVEEDRYAPDEPVTRAQMATFVANAQDWASDDLRSDVQQFEDVGAESVHFEAVNGLALQRIVVGDTDGLYHPGQAVTRAQMSAFLMRHADLLVERGLIRPPEDDDTDASEEEPVADDAPPNVILLVGDGMTDTELTVARLYEHGRDGRLHVDDMPVRSAVAVSAVREDDPAAPVYVTDSAAGATAWSTGTRTSGGRLSTTAGSDQDLTTIMQLAEQAGVRTGNVSTARLTDATPAAPMANVASRACQGPEDTSSRCPQDATENGGPGSVAEQSVDLGVDVLLGGGADRYDQTIQGGEFAGSTVTEWAQARGYTVVRDAGELDGVDTTPVLGLFAPGHLPTERTGPRAVEGGTEATCEPNPEFGDDVPAIDEMTDRAIELLDANDAGQGFFLQVEGASIDKQAHAARPCDQIGETVAFDRAVGVALDFAAAHGNTTVIVTSDHGQSTQLIPAGADDSPGATATLTSADGEPMQLNYATSTGSQTHTGPSVPYFAEGGDPERPPALIEQTGIFEILARALEVQP